MTQLTVKTIEMKGKELIVTCDVPKGTWLDEAENTSEKNHPIHIPLAALANRMVLYGLDTPEEALEAILREQCVRLGDMEPHDIDAHLEALKAVEDGVHTREHKALLLGGQHPKATIKTKHDFHEALSEQRISIRDLFTDKTREPKSEKRSS